MLAMLVIFIIMLAKPLLNIMLMLTASGIIGYKPTI